MIRRLTRALALRPLTERGARFHRQNSTVVTFSPGSQGALRRNARASGRENYPGSLARTPTEFETEIIRSFERLHRERGEPARAEVQRLAAQFTSLEASLPGERDLVNRVVSVGGDVDREVGSAGELASFWVERERRLRDLRVFARDHGLARDARYPESRLLHLGLLAVLLLVEAWLNTRFFSEATDLGLVGGFLAAFGIALVNVASGFIAGWLVLPWLAYRSALARVVALFGLVVMAVLAGTLNLAGAAFRDRLGAGIPGVASLHDLLRDPFDLSFMSAALLVTGLLAWGVACWKGRTFDDGYPFYGARDRSFRNADSAFLTGQDAFAARVIGRVQRLPVDLQEVLANGHATLARLDTVVVAAHRTRDAYETDRADLQARCTSLLKAWREENAFVRTKPPPTYFAEYPSFTTLVPETNVGELAERAARARVRHEDLGVRAHIIVLENGERVAAALARVQAHVADVTRSHWDGGTGANGERPPSGRAVA